VDKVPVDKVPVDKVEVELYARECNVAVLHLPGRRFPGVFLQGDTFARLRNDVATARAAIESGGVNEARDCLDSALQELDSALQEMDYLLGMYISALTTAGLPIPFRWRGSSGGGDSS
jgi:hypothetical protein